jgi:two-component system OmpR family sensor kinase
VRLIHRIHPMSLRLRLTTVFAVAMAVVLAALAAFLHGWLAAELQHEIDRSLGAHADTLLANASAPDVTSSARFVDPDEAFAQLLTPAGRILESSRGLGSRPALTTAQAESASAGRATYVTQHVDIADLDHRLGDPDRDVHRLLATPITLRGRRAVLVVGQTLSDRDEALTRQLQLFAVALPVALLLTTAAGWLLAGAALRPVESMRRRAAALSARDHGGRLPVPGTGDELARLALTLNDLLERLHRAMEREHRFVDDASHELRTPLAVLKAELDLALTRPRPPDQLRGALQAAATYTDELVRLAEDLLVLARMRGGRLPLHRVPTDLPGMLDRAMDPLRPAAVTAERTLRIDAPDIQVCLDPIRMRQAVLNLVDNALRHGRGTITVAATATPTILTIDVRDEGDGFPPDLEDRAFEPFVRGAATSPAPRGAGLGLAIVQAVATAHGGSARTGRDPGGGARVRVELPLEPYRAAVVRSHEAGSASSGR